MATVVLCDDHRMFVESLALVLRARGHQVVACGSTPAEAVAAVAAHRPAVLVVDLNFPDGDGDGIQAITAALEVSPTTRSIALSGMGQPDWFLRARAAGAAAALVKDGSIDKITDAIDAVSAGREVFDVPRNCAAPRPAAVAADAAKRLTRLTGREREVLERLRRGQSTATIGVEMGMALSTTRSHIQHVLTKLGVHSKLEAVALASRADLEEEHPHLVVRNTPFAGGNRAPAQ